MKKRHRRAEKQFDLAKILEKELKDLATGEC
jgi:hypothetical protein